MAPDPTAQPMFSVVIPTRDRPATLPLAVASVLAQEERDFELLVVDNASAAPADEVLAEQRCPQLRILRTTERLAMHRNWEFGLAAARGRYVIFIGDDDALMPDGLRQASMLLAGNPVDLLCWPTHDYKWPDAAATPGQMVVRFGDLAGDLDLPGHLAAAFGLVAEEVYLTSIYHGAVSADLIRRVREAQGGVYFSDPVCDIESELLNAFYGRSAMLTQRPVSMNGHSGGSNGGANGQADRLSAAYDRFAAEAGLTARDLAPGNTGLPLYHATVVAGCQLRVKARHFPQDNRYRYHPEHLLRWLVAASASFGAGRAPDLVQGFRELAAWLAIVPPPIALPRQQAPARPRRGLHAVSDGDMRVVVDTLAAGVRDVGGAVRLCQSMLEPAGRPAAVPAAQAAAEPGAALPSSAELAAELHSRGEAAVFERLRLLQEQGLEGWENWDSGDTTAPIYVRFSATGAFGAAQQLHDTLTRRGRALWPDSFDGLRRDAIARGVPPIMLVSLPKSGSVYLQNGLITLLRVPHLRISLSRFPNDYPVGEALRLFAEGGAVAQSHLDASTANLDALAAAGIQRIHVHVRDPRQASVSWTAHVAAELVGEHAFLRHLTDPLPPAGFADLPLADRLEWHARNHFPACLRWLMQWLHVAEADPRFRIRFTDHEVLQADALTVFRDLLEHFGAPREQVTQASIRAPRQGVDHYRQGSNTEWRRVLPPAVQGWMNGLMPPALKARFGWPDS
ncbi:MAG: glycosyltransferase family 2 protein [Sneathiellaceae bacterium]